jgi:hypothetical protein
MVTSREQDDVCCDENITCVQYTVAEGASINGEYYLSESINVITKFTR